jgi:hypothetical protein
MRATKVSEPHSEEALTQQHPVEADIPPHKPVRVAVESTDAPGLTSARYAPM